MKVSLKKEWFIGKVSKYYWLNKKSNEFITYSTSFTSKPIWSLSLKIINIQLLHKWISSFHNLLNQIASELVKLFSI